MKHLLLIGLIIAFAASCEGGLWDMEVGITVRFDLSLTGMGSEYFMNVPLNKTQCDSMNWTLTDSCSCSGSAEYDELLTYCVPEYSICALIEKNSGLIAGLQFGIPEKKFTPALDMPEQGWSLCAIGEETYWIIKIFLVSKTWMEKSPEEKISAFNSSSVILQENAVWLTVNKGELMKVEANTTGLITDTKWTKQNYVFWMGQHYYYNMSSTLECTSDQLSPFFLLEHGSTLVGTGLMVFGTMTKDENAKDYFESPAQAAVKFIVNNGPECFYDLAENPGAITMHIYYTSSPYKILWG